MEKKNTGLIITIVVLTLLLCGLGGYIIIEKLFDNNYIADNNSNNNSGNNVDGEKDYSLNAASVLMEDYIVDYYSSEKYITDLSNEADKNYLAIRNSKDKKVKCSDVEINEKESEMVKSSFENSCDPAMNALDGHLESYEYNEVLNSKKSLFGSNVNLEKKNFEAGLLYYYDNTKNAFISLQISKGGVPTSFEGSGIYSAKEENGNVKIVAYFYKLDSIENNGSITGYTINTKSGVKQIKETNLVEAIFAAQEYKDILEKYEYVFKNENNHYYLTNITKIK